MFPHPHTPKLKDLLKELGQKISIISHPRADADALGSSLAFYHFLEAKGHHVTVITPTDFPAFLNWLPGCHTVVNYEAKGGKEKTENTFAQADIIFCLDFGNLARIGEIGDLVRKSKATKVLVDHHLEPEEFCELKFWNPSSAATAELVFQIFKDLGEQKNITKEIAECLYAGILTDTGMFRHPTTTRNTHLIVADLMQSGIQVSKIHKLIYDNNTIGRLRLLGKALANNLFILEEYNTAYIALTQNDLGGFKCGMGDTEGIVNYALSIEGIVLGAIFIERNNGVKVSFRSVGSFSVNNFARKHFNGGGHSNAAGGWLEGLNIEQAVKFFKESLSDFKSELDNKVLK